MANHITITTEPPTAPLGPTVTGHKQLADDVVKAFDAITGTIPDLPEAERAVANFRRRELAVSLEFCAATIAAVEQMPELQALGKLDPAVGHDILQYLDAFLVVRNRGDAFVRNVKFTYDSKKGSLGRACLQIYYLAKGLARDTKNPELEAHIDNMARALGRKGVTRKQSEKRKAAKAAAAGKEVIAA